MFERSAARRRSGVTVYSAQPPLGPVPAHYSGSGGDDRSRWRIAERIFAIIGVIAALIAVIGVIAKGISHLPNSELHHEEGMVSSLTPGDDYSKMVALIGTQPDFHQSLSSGLQLYVYNRRWEYIQLLVDQTDEVLSLGVYAKTTEFKAILAAGAMVNGPPVGRQLHNGQLSIIPVPIGAYGECGISSEFRSYYYFFQGYGLAVPDGSIAASQGTTGNSVIFGDLSLADTNESMPIEALCNYLQSAPSEIDTPPLSSELLNDLTWGKGRNAMISNLVPSAVIVTAPNQPAIRPDMLNQDYFDQFNDLGF